MELNPTTLFVNQKSTNSKIFELTKQAHPQAKIIPIQTNTRISDPEYNLISIDPKKRGLQKRKYIAVLHRDAKWDLDPNGRSTDFLPNKMLSSGCKFNCSYCFVDRHDPATFPKIYDDVFQFVDMVRAACLNKDKSRALFRKVCSKDLEQYRDPKHGKYITFDIGCDSDVTLDNQMTASDNYPGHIVDIINQVADIPEAMVSFASKATDFDNFIKYIKKPEMCRIRLSMMPEHHRQVLEMNTSKIFSRACAINKLVEAGFEVHINLSPIVVTKNLTQEYTELLKFIHENLSDKAKKQLAYEAIFLTHSEKLFDVVPQYAPKAHEMMVQGPFDLVPKDNKPNVLSYSKEDKKMFKSILEVLIKKHTPYSRIRYMF